MKIVEKLHWVIVSLGISARLNGSAAPTREELKTAKTEFKNARRRVGTELKNLERALRQR